MLRTCDGKDPNLIRRKLIPVVAATTSSVEATEVLYVEYETCDCGKTFDDVYHMVIYPHERF